MLNIIYNDLAHPWQIGFQDSASPGFSGIVQLHNEIFFYLVLVAVGVFWILGSVIYSFGAKNNKLVAKYLNHGTLKCLHTSLLKNNVRKVSLLNINESIKKKTENKLSLKLIREFSSHIKENYIIPNCATRGK